MVLFRDDNISHEEGLKQHLLMSSIEFRSDAEERCSDRRTTYRANEIVGPCKEVRPIKETSYKILTQKVPRWFSTNEMLLKANEQAGKSEETRQRGTAACLVQSE